MAKKIRPITKKIRLSLKCACGGWANIVSEWPEDAAEYLGWDCEYGGHDKLVWLCPACVEKRRIEQRKEERRTSLLDTIENGELEDGHWGDQSWEDFWEQAELEKSKEKA